MKFTIAATAIALALAAPLAAPAQEIDYDSVDPTGATATVWYRVNRPEQIALIDEMTAQFNEANDYGITVEAVSAGGYGDIFTRFVNLIGTDELPDMTIAYQNQAALFNMPGSDALIDMTPLVESDRWGMPDEVMADIPAGILAQDIAADFGGIRLGFPPRRSMEVMYVNLDWLAELGYDEIPSDPATFAEAACTAAATPFSGATDAAASPTGLEFGLDASRLASFILAHGGETFDPAQERYVFDGEGAMAAAMLMSDLAQNGCLRAATERNGEQVSFANGTALFTTGSTSGGPYYRSAVNEGADFDYTIAPLPYTTDAPRGNVYGPSFSIVDSGDPARQIAAFLWLQEFVSPEFQAAFTEVTNYVPVRVSAMELLDDYRAENPEFEVIRELMTTGASETPPSASYEEVRGLLNEALAAIIDGDDPEQVMLDLNEEANRLHAEVLAQLAE